MPPTPDQSPDPPSDHHDPQAERRSDRPRVVLATLPTAADAQQAQYGLRLRGVACDLNSPRSRSGPVEVLIDQDDLDRARASWPYIIDALPHSIRAVDADGRCAFCKYDCSGLPRGNPCPECGAVLDAATTRLAARDGKRQPDPPDAGAGHA